MKNKKKILIRVLFIIALVIILLATCTVNSRAEMVPVLSPTNPISQPKEPSELELSTISQASLVIPVSNFYRDQNKLNMTILKSASTYETASRGATVIAYQKTSSMAPTLCPLINASSMHKTITDYDTFRGSADITITFKNSNIAEVVEKAECFLVRNKE